MDSDDRMAELKQQLIEENKNTGNYGLPGHDVSSASFQINDDEDMLENGSPNTDRQFNKNKGNNYHQNNNGDDNLPRFASLADLPANSNIDDILNPQREAELLKPFSSRVKLVFEYDDNTKKYKISENDK